MIAASLPAVGDIVAGRLRVVRSLGAGGMGAVFEVEHTLTKHRRALKLLHGEYARSPAVVTRFLREASAAGRIGNPHVVETFDAGRLDSGEPYIVMELLEGLTLADELARRGTIPVAETCDILLQACDGVRAAHAAGIVHRDLKPENLFLIKGEGSFVKILDFGISKFDPDLTGTHALTHEGLALGTPYYMPPEQVRGEKDIGVQADVYSLGVILYECLTADKPYAAETLPHLAVLIYEGRYTPPSVRNPGLPPECDQVVALALASDRSRRYADIDELARGLIALRDTVASSAGREQARPLATAPSSSTPSDPASIPPHSPSDGATPAQTSGAFGQTHHGEQRRPAWLVWVLVAMAALMLVGLQRWLSRSSNVVQTKPETVKDSNMETPSSTFAARPAPPAVPSKPEVSPMLSASAGESPEAAPAPSARTGAPRQPKVAAPRASSRARELGLSEDNPF